MAARVGIGDVGPAAAAEFAVELDAAPDIDHDDEGRAALLGGQAPGVLHRLAMGAQHGLVPTAGVQRQPGLLGFKDIAGATVEVDEALGLGTVAVLEDDPALEAVGVRLEVPAGRVGLGQPEQGAEFGEEELVVGPLGPACALPANDEGVDGRRAGLAGDGLRVVGVYGAGSGDGGRVSGCNRLNASSQVD